MNTAEELGRALELCAEQVREGPPSAAGAEDITARFIEEQLRAGIYERCPACAILIEKIDGCNWVKCMCGAEFCWFHKQIKGAADSMCPYGNPVCNSH